MVEASQRNLQLGSVEFVVDVNRNPCVDTHQWDWCQCDGCTEERITRERFMPSELREFLKAAKLDPMRPAWVNGTGKKKGDPPRTYRRTLTWYAYGRVMQSTNKTTKVRFADGNSAWVETDPTPEEEQHYRQFSPQLDRTGLIYIRASLFYPRLLDEFESQELNQNTLCPQCRRSGAVCGPLVPSSLLAGWYGLPDLAKALEQPNNKVMVTLCTDCGHVTWTEKHS